MITVSVLRLKKSVAAQFSSVQSLDQLDHQAGHDGRFSRDPLPVFSAGGPLFDVVYLAFPLLTTVA